MGELRKSIYDKAKRNIDAAQKKDKFYYDQKHSSSPKEQQKGVQEGWQTGTTMTWTLLDSWVPRKRHLPIVQS